MKKSKLLIEKTDSYAVFGITKSNGGLTYEVHFGYTELEDGTSKCYWIETVDSYKDLRTLLNESDFDENKDNNYVVQIREMSIKNIPIKAKSPEEAEFLIAKKFQNKEIVITKEDFLNQTDIRTVTAKGFDITPWTINGANNL